MNHPEFDDIRPYRDEEIPAAMQRIASSEFFPLLATYIFPEVLFHLNIKTYLLQHG